MFQLLALLIKSHCSSRPRIPVTLTACSEWEPSQLESLSTISNYNGYAISCFGGSDGFINVSTNGGAGDYTYIWSGTSSENISNLGSGTYYLTTIDSNGCSIDSEFIINEPSEINVTVSVENPECYGDLGSADINLSLIHI